MAKLRHFWNFIVEHKYAVTIVLFLLWMTFIDDNNFISTYRRHREAKALNAQTELYKQQYETYSKEVDALENDPSAVERRAREDFYMQRANEDVFVVATSDEPKASNAQEQ